MTDNVTLLDRFKGYIENEPVKFMEMVRFLLVSVPVVAGLTIGTPIVTLTLGVLAFGMSVFGSKKVRDKVTPYWKVESGEYNQFVAESIEDYESSN